MAADELKKIATEGHVAFYLNFDTTKATLRPDAQPTIAQVLLLLLQQSPALRLAVQGHTGNTSTPAHNQQLSEARAQAIGARPPSPRRASLPATCKPRVLTKPLTDKAIETGRAQNRRVELVKL